MTTHAITGKLEPPHGNPPMTNLLLECACGWLALASEPFPVGADLQEMNVDALQPQYKMAVGHMKKITEDWASKGLIELMEQVTALAD